MSKIIKYMKPYYLAILIAIFLKAIGALVDMWIPKIMGTVINTGIAGSDTNAIRNGCIVMLIMTAISLVANTVSHYMSAKNTMAVGNILRKKVYEKIQRLKIKDIEKVETSSLITRVTNDVENIQNAIEMCQRPIVRAPLTVIIGVVMTLQISVKLTLYMFIGMIIMFSISLSVMKYTRPIFRKVQRNLDKLTEILRENIMGIRVIKSFNKGEYEAKRFDLQSANVRQLENKAGIFNGIVRPLMTFISSAVTAIILYISGFEVNGGKMLIGDVFSVVAYIDSILMAMAFIPRLIMMISRSNISANRLTEVIDIDEETDYGKEIEALATDKIIEFDDVSFRYPDSREKALKHVSFTVKRGETLGVIGDTGCGKTTLLNLMLRLYDATDGEILFEGRNIKCYAKEFLNKNITAALQQYNIFGMTIGKNIELDNKNDEKRLKKASDTAQLTPVVEEKENGYDYSLAQSGNNLSGGQKQRISIARTLYRQTDLTILDDVSSALDYRTDYRLRKAIKENYKGKSLIIISQRVSAVKSSDKIIVMDKGRIAGTGTHTELLNSCEKYKEICKAQNADREESVAV